MYANYFITPSPLVAPPNSNSFAPNLPSAGNPPGFGGAAKSDLHVLAHPPTDSVSSLQFNPTGSFLVASSWAGDVRCWEIDNATGQSRPRALKDLASPVLAASWSHDGSKVFAAACDNTASVWDLQADTLVRFARHDAPVKTVCASSAFVVTGSWDKTLKFWDLRQSAPARTFHLPDKCYCADALGSVLIVAGAGRFINAYDSATGTLQGQIACPLPFQLRCIRLFSDTNNSPRGFALGSTGSRAAVQYFGEPACTIKCNRTFVSNTVHLSPVNDIAFHPTFKTFATVGSDGSFQLFDAGYKHTILLFFLTNYQIPQESHSIVCLGESTTFATAPCGSRPLRYRVVP